jgi:hypothetical protein
MGDYTRRYGFIQEVDQHGNQVDPYFYDRGEELGINAFERIVLNLRDKPEPHVMIELGSNQAYYSCLFNAILRDYETKTILVEPYDKFMPRSKRHFEINGFEASFDNRSIGDTWECWQKYKFTNGEVTVDQLLEEHGLDYVSMLHADIDGSEEKMISGANKSLSQKKIHWLFILTHGQEIHSNCMNEIIDHNYEIVIHYEGGQVGTDGLIIAKA